LELTIVLRVFALFAQVQELILVWIDEMSAELPLRYYQKGN